MTTLDERLVRLRKSAENVRRATNPHQRTAALRYLATRAQEIDARRTALVHKLDNGWDWLELNPGADGYDELEARYLGWLGEYERICDALREAQDVWTRPREERAA